FIVGILSLLIAAGTSSAQTKALASNRTATAEGLPLRANAAHPIKLRVSFKLRNEAQLKQLLADQQNPKSPRFHRWLTPAQFNARFGRTAKEVREVQEWLASEGFKVDKASGRDVTVNGTIGTAEGAFATTFAASSDGSSFGIVNDPQIPEKFAG